jgi:protein SCO1/2
MATPQATLFCIALSVFAPDPCGAGLHEPPHVALRQLPQEWTDDNGQTLPLTVLKGERVVLTMAFASCHRFCPMTLEALEQMQQRADERGERLTFLIVSYDPANDTTDVWRRYREHHHLSRPNWHFVRGSAPDTRRLARQLGFTFWVYDDHVIHESHAVVFDAQGNAQAALDSHVSHWSDVL